MKTVKGFLPLDIRHLHLALPTLTVLIIEPIVKLRLCATFFNVAQREDDDYRNLPSH